MIEMHAQITGQTEKSSHGHKANESKQIDRSSFVNWKLLIFGEYFILVIVEHYFSQAFPILLFLLGAGGHFPPEKNTQKKTISIKHIFDNEYFCFLKEQHWQ